MSQKEAKRVKVLDMLNEGKIDQKKASKRMGIRPRQVRHLSKRQGQAPVVNSNSRNGRVDKAVAQHGAQASRRSSVEKSAYRKIHDRQAARGCIKRETGKTRWLCFAGKRTLLFGVDKESMREIPRLLDSAFPGSL